MNAIREQNHEIHAAESRRHALSAAFRSRTLTPRTPRRTRSMFRWRTLLGLRDASQRHDRQMLPPAAILDAQLDLDAGPPSNERCGRNRTGISHLLTSEPAVSKCVSPGEPNPKKFELGSICQTARGPFSLGPAKVARLSPTLLAAEVRGGSPRARRVEPCS